MKDSFKVESSVKTVADMPEMAELIREKITELEAQGSEDAFIMGNMGDIVHKYVKWMRLMPRVEPFYAVKCNNDDQVVKLLATLGTGFDCASKAEFTQILKLGVNPSRIIYANPCKQKSHIQSAQKKNVDLMTFDNEAELIKIKAIFPNARLVLRLLPSAGFKVQCELGNKFGCSPDNVAKLLAKAQELDLNIVGISFHVGSGVEEPEAFSVAVKQSYDAWNTALEYGFDMKILDIGGGFPGTQDAPVTFEEIAIVLNDALDRYFPEDSGVRIIAEPGRYFVASAFTLAGNIIAKRTVARDISNNSSSSPDGHHQQNVSSNDEPSHMYYINDGVYGSFNSLLYDHAKVKALHFEDASAAQYTSSVWGPTCDGLDCILDETRLPELEVGDWIYFPDMGAYTISAGSTFNGMPQPSRHYYCSASVWAEVKNAVQGFPKNGKFPAVMKSGLDVDVLHDLLCKDKMAIEEQVLA